MILIALISRLPPVLHLRFQEFYYGFGSVRCTKHILLVILLHQNQKNIILNQFNS
jgi:hypothetical protein